MWWIGGVSEWKKRAVGASRLKRRSGMSQQACPARRYAGRSLLLSCFTIVCGSAFADDVYSHFGFCSAPTPPSCVKDISPGSAQIEPCQQDAERYVAAVFAYRTCLAAEMERAVREANTTIEAIRCVMGKAVCPAPAPKDQDKNARDP
jgi:hypothetical protein